jgi:hypothetical protein
MQYFQCVYVLTETHHMRRAQNFLFVAQKVLDLGIFWISDLQVRAAQPD